MPGIISWDIEHLQADRKLQTEAFKVLHYIIYQDF